jgi:hypothetical protein
VRLEINNLHDKSQADALATFQFTAFPKLETLVMRECQLREWLKGVILPNIRFFRSTVAQGHWASGFEMKDVVSSLPGLTSCNLKVSAVDAIDLVTFFNNPHLREATVSLPAWSSEEPAGKSSSKVTKLHMNGQLGSQSKKFTELYFPKLEVFSWSDAFDMKPHAIRVQLKNLIETSHPPLHTLIFERIEIKERALKETLTALPTLRILKLTSTRISDDFIELLSSDQGLCPTLDVLAVNVKKSPYGYPRITRSALESLKDSRNRELAIIYNGEPI